MRLPGAAEDVLRFGAARGYPLILKPTSLYSSFFVTRIDGPEQVGRVFAETRVRSRAYARQAGLPRPRWGLQVERFLAGTLHSVDCLVDRRGVVHLTPVVDVLTGHDIGRDGFYDFARLAPSALPTADQQAILRMVARGISALGLRDTPAHAEVILTEDGPRLTEVGARPGGNRTRLLLEAHGVDVMAAVLDVNQGRPPRVDPLRKPGRPFAIVTPFPSAAGTFQSLRGAERVTGLPSYRWHQVTVQQGATISTPPQGQFSFVNIELSSASADQVRQDVARIAAMADLIDLSGPGGTPPANAARTRRRASSASRREAGRPHLILAGLARTSPSRTYESWPST